MDMNRRQVVRAASVGFVALAIPGWFAACARRDGDSGPNPPPEVPNPTGRSRLLLHVEQDDRQAYDLGMLVGTFLMHAPDDEIAPLATVDLACATTSEIKKLAPQLEGLPRTLAAIVTPSGTFEGVVSGDPPPNRSNGYDVDVATASVRAQHTWFAQQLARGLGTDAETLKRRAAAERAVIGSSPEAEMSKLEYARRWPNHARWIAECEPEQRAEWIAALAAVARERWKMDAPTGSTWAKSTGCGIECEKPAKGRENLGVLCGMGFTPPISQRFLHFYTAEEMRG